MNVQEAWAMGYTGKGVVVTILDDGIERNHPDLKDNYDPKASYDVNDHDSDPIPRYDFANENRHGTRCAGEVAAIANNTICSVGIAYKASIGGVRMLDGDVTDAVEAQSLSLNPQHIDIYSVSWGPDDDGKTVDGPAKLALKAFTDGVRVGRGGLGSIFVWASGNGGRDKDSCNCDGYTNSIYTLSVSSATENGRVPWYSEACSSTLATTYSSGGSGEKQIVTTDLRKGCTETHTGTSASAPLAAGIVALALQANSQLTWRDMQHIVVLSAKPYKLNAPDWKTNGVGRRVSHSYGYGMMDATAMVKLSQNWTNVPEQQRCETPYLNGSKSFSKKSTLSVSVQTDGCGRVNYLEHVQAIVELSTSCRGEISIKLKSPSGTESVLLTKRPKDNFKKGFKNWAFMTTHSWGELSHGLWTLKIDSGNAEGKLESWKLVTWGTTTPPYQKPKQETSVPICHEGEYFLEGYCYKQCPVNFYEMNTTSSTNSTGSCLPCHKSCQRCNGELESNCIQCKDGWKLTNETFCTHLGKSINSFAVLVIQEKDWTKITIMSIIFGSVALTIVVIALVIIVIRKKHGKGEYKNYDQDAGNPLLSNGLSDGNEFAYFDDVEKSAAPI
ncbi:DgyrCDS11503 [Dimorphilus gyrociliatus]|uniref:DgyrCDS11503 n=1 Tax=Dimorphilus gyrociliatus TaxID=2664684 RepID=A0A7I8W4G5_9ANNE|nr:DgyrCDS11503 [Dimorphilus gyrociliatus]